MQSLLRAKPLPTIYTTIKRQREFFKHFPQIKLAVILRDPIDRTLSRYSMMVRNGAEKT